MTCYPLQFLSMRHLMEGFLVLYQQLIDRAEALRSMWVHACDKLEWPRGDFLSCSCYTNDH